MRHFRRQQPGNLVKRQDLLALRAEASHGSPAQPSTLPETLDPLLGREAEAEDLGRVLDDARDLERGSGDHSLSEKMLEFMKDSARIVRGPGGGSGAGES